MRIVANYETGWELKVSLLFILALMDMLLDRSISLCLRSSSKILGCQVDYRMQGRS